MRLLGEFVYFFYEDILHTKKACKAPKQRLLRYLLIGQFIYLFFYEDILHTKKPIKHSSNVYSDIPIRLKA